MTVDEVTANTARMARRLERERQSRLDAEQIAERATRELYETVQVVALLQHVAVAANEAVTFEDATAIALAAVCEHTGWPVGHLYVTDTPGHLAAAGVWHVDDRQRCRRFMEVTAATPLGVGEGLPGRVLATGRPAWIPDLSADPTFARARAAADIEVWSGFAFPVVVGPEVVGVLEFFAYEPTELKESLLDVMANIGAQLGRVVERQRAAEAVFQSERRLREVIATASDAFVATDSGGHIVEWNHQAEQYFGWTHDEAVGRLLTDTIIPPADRGAHASGVGRFLAHGHGPVPERRVEVQACHRDGRQFLVEMTPWVVGGGSTWRFNAFIHDITERKAFEAELEHQALHDHLTGLANRALLVDRIAQALARTDRGEVGPAVLFIDLDGFKLINDSFGHAVGDRLLGVVAQRLAGVLRPTDTLARHAGDEFAVVLDDIDDPRDAAVVAERIGEALAPPVELDGESVYVTASVGVAFAEGDSTPEALLADADAAMYRAKSAGRGRFEIFGEGMRSRASHRLRLEGQLHDALTSGGELELHYQPIVALDTTTVVGAEALLRWNHPERGLLLPGEFIKLAEDSGLIVPIGAWILAEACRQARRWEAELGVEDFEIAVNLSARQLVQADFVDSVAAILDTADLPADRIQLCLEITETVLIADHDTSAGVLNDLQSLGFRLAIDDFGTGYSSLAYLRSFPVDLVKLDRSFIAAVDCAPVDRTIVGAVIDLAHALELTVIAEGVETHGQLHTLQQLGCDMAQGYLFARPAPAAAITPMLCQPPLDAPALALRSPSNARTAS